MNHLHLHMALELNQQLRNSMSGNFLWAHPLTLAVFFFPHSTREQLPNVLYHRVVFALYGYTCKIQHYWATATSIGGVTQLTFPATESTYLSSPNTVIFLHFFFYLPHVSLFNLSVRHHMANDYFVLGHKKPSSKEVRENNNICFPRNLLATAECPRPWNGPPFSTPSTSGQTN